MLKTPRDCPRRAANLGFPKCSGDTIPKGAATFNWEPSEPAIRPARAADRHAVEGVVRDAYSLYVARIGGPPVPMTADYGELIAAGQVYVLEAGGRLAGLVVLVDEPGYLLLENVAVAPAFQGHGLGRQLVAFAEQEAAARGLPEVRLYTNEAMTENLRLYPALGYEEVGRAVEDGFARVYFRKPVTPAPP
jgi:ribosomal protein S18 acetylase RimI-like enzyme